MMDTGVDAPRVVNLVFFKLVRSTSKFMQMVGRGTRLCPDLFAHGEDKTEFLIFDFCKNFEFFDQNPDGVEGSTIKTLSQKIFEAKLEVALLIRGKDNPTTNALELSANYINDLHTIIDSLDQNRFIVKKELRFVIEYKNKSRWNNLSKGDVLDINTQLSHLVLPNSDDDEQARRFDIFILQFQIAMLSGTSDTGKYVSRINSIAKALMKKQNIPQISLHSKILTDLQTELFWKAVTVNKLDEVRLALRDLIKFLDKEQQVNVITHFEDEIYKPEISNTGVLPVGSSLKNYRERVESYIREHKDHLVIHKLNTNIPITEKELDTLEEILFTDDEIGTKQDFLAEYGNQPLGQFVRSIVGLDIKSANQIFSDFIQSGNLKADQITFINNIISYLTKNGTIDKGMLFEPPFTDVHDQGLPGVFDDALATKVIKLIDTVNNNALVQTA